MRAREIALVLGVLLAIPGCLIEKKAEPGFCGAGSKCPEGFRCSEESGASWHRCVCASASCADAGAGDLPSDGRDAMIDARDGGGDAGDAARDEAASDLPPDVASGCTGDKDCSGGRPRCSPGGECVACLADMHCTDTAKSFCVGGSCVGCDGAAAGACAARSAATPACGSGGACVECVASTDCSTDPAKPICTPSNKCIRCSTDMECAARPGGPGVCMSHQDGRCASDAETLYVQNKAGCAASPPGGSVAMPFCGGQAAINQVSAARRVIVVIGPAAAGGFEWFAGGAGAAQVTVVGRSGAVWSGGGPVIRVSGGDLFMRNVTISGGSDAGVVAELGATLRLHEATVDGNAKGGIRSAGSAFEIVNCIITNNGAGLAGPTGFGGVFLGSGVGGSKVFAFNTVANNKDKGVVCESSSQVVDGLLLWTNTVADAANCAVTLSKTTADGDPKLTPTFRLTSSSPCRNAVSPAPLDAPSIDIDGNARPQEGVLDCGASEFVKP